MRPTSSTATRSCAAGLAGRRLPGASRSAPTRVGRDILSRLIYGARFSLLIGAVVMRSRMIVGVALGLVAGFARGWVDTLIMRLMDIILAFPACCWRSSSSRSSAPACQRHDRHRASCYMPHFARLTRAAVIGELSKDYVTAARVAGAGRFALMFGTVLPNCLAPLIVQATLGFSNAILDAAALGFLGMGAQPPTPEWGTMLADAREFVLRAWWVVTFPGLAILITVLAINLIGDGLRDALDPS